MAESDSHILPDSIEITPTPGKGLGKNRGNAVFTRTPSGGQVNIFDLLSKEKERGEQLVNTSLLRPGYILGMQYTVEDGSEREMMFTIDGAEVADGGINVGAPRQMAIGYLQGNLPDEAVDEHFNLVGSGWGGPIQFGVIANHRAFYFDSGRTRYISPEIDKFGVFIPQGENEIVSMSLNQLKAEARETSEVHETRLAQVEAIKNLFGFGGNLKDCSQITIDYPLTHEDERYIAEYSEGMATGNRLTVFDKNTNLWMEFGYFDFQGEGALKVSFADLSGLNHNEVFSASHIGAGHTILGLDVPVITYNTSANTGFNVINYRPGDKDLGELGIADYDPDKYRYKGKPSPNILLFPDGSFSLDHRGYFTPIEESHPGALQSIQNAVSVSKTPEGSTQFSFNGHDISIVNPDSELNLLLTTLNKNQTADNEANSAISVNNAASREPQQKLKNIRGKLEQILKRKK